MLPMPSFWNLLISTVVFFVAAWYFRRFLLEQDIQKGFTLNVVVITFATVASFAADAMMGSVEHKIADKKPVLQTPAPTAEVPQSAVAGSGQE